MAARRQECSICMDCFKNPKLISCHHSFCYKCLDDYVQVNIRNGRFNCPICRKSVELPEGGVSALQSNFYIDIDAGDTFACDICGPKNVACSRCLDCEENLCKSCCYVHEKSKALRHHKISDLGTLDSETKGKFRQRIFCDQHPDDEIRLLCRDCQALICFMCKVVKHETHVTKPVPDAAAEMKKTLETKLNECLDQLRRIEASKKKGEELDKSINDAEQEELKAVDDQGSQLCKAIVQELEKVKARIKHVYHDLRQRNAVFTRDVEEEFKSCSNAKDIAQTLTYQGTDIDIIKKGTAVKQLISAAISKTEQTPNTRLENKLFSPAEMKQCVLIALLGMMEDSAEEERNKKEREEREKNEREEKEIKERSNGMEARVKALEEELSSTRKQYEETKADAITKGLKLTQAEKEIEVLGNQHADVVQSNGMKTRVKALEEELSNARKQYEETKADANTKGLKLTQAEKEIEVLRNQIAAHVAQEEKARKEQEEKEKKEREEKEIQAFPSSPLLLLSEEKLLRMELERKVKIQNEEIRRLSDAQQLLHNYSAAAASDRKPTVAFSVQLSNDIVNVSPGHRVIFDKVVLNQEGAFDVTTGIFRAPVSGIYQFFLQTCSPPKKFGHLYLIQDGRTVGFAPTSSSDWSCIGISSVVQLQEGNKVWVEMSGYASGLYFLTDKYMHIRTALSGFYVGRA